MKKIINLNNLCVLTMVLVISSCATGNRLTFVKAHPVNTTVAKNTTTHQALPEAALSSPVVIDNTDNIVTAPPINALASTPNATPTHHKALRAFNKHISAGAIALVKVVKKSTARYAKPMLKADGGDGDNSGLRTAIALIIIGLLLQLFWALPNIGYIFAVIGEILIIIGIIELILWLL